MSSAKTLNVIVDDSFCRRLNDTPVNVVGHRGVASHSPGRRLLQGNGSDRGPTAAGKLCRVSKPTWGKNVFCISSVSNDDDVDNGNRNDFNTSLATSATLYIWTTFEVTFLGWFGSFQKIAYCDVLAKY